MFTLEYGVIWYKALYPMENWSILVAFEPTNDQHSN